MFEKIRALLSGESVIKKAYDETCEMLDVVATLYDEATALLLDGASPKVDIHMEDKRINEMEMGIRREILEHLSVNPQVEVGASLVLSSVVGYVERAGDYTKNIEELARMLGHPLRPNEAIRPLIEIVDKVGQSIRQTREAFHDENETLAAEIIKRHKEIRRVCDGVLEDAFEAEAVDKETLVAAVYARYLKRISAGMKNVCTAVLVPFDHIGYSRGIAKKE